MPDIFLYAGEATPSDIKLSDPTVVIPSGSYFGILKRWTGASWIKEPLKVWTGSFVSKPLKRWNGTEWKLIDTTGI